MVVVTCAPWLLHLLGVNLGTPFELPPLLQATPGGELRALHNALRGSLVHVLLEWSAVVIAIISAIFALVYARYTGDEVAPIMALALFASSWTDTLHALAATFLIEGAADSTNFIPFTWTLSRMFHVAVLIVGAVSVLWWPRLTQRQGRWRLDLVLGFLFLLVAYALIHLCAVSPVLPRTMYPEAWLTRPWDIVPLVLLLIAGIWLFPQLYRRHPSSFTLSLWLAVLPGIVTQLHMSFGSADLFDSHFHIAHFTKAVAYAVPLCGIILDYAFAHRNLADKQRLEELSRKLEAHTQELERTNSELKQFAYVASHDLRAPLRAIDNLSRWLQEDLEDRLTGDDRKHLELLRGRVKRMDALLEALLEYSRVGRVQGVLSRVDVGELLADTVDLHAPPASFTVSIGPGMPVLETDRTALQQVFANLIGNALKHHDRPAGCIEITWAEEGEFHAFTVRDDGPGIPPAFHVKVFEMFQTLKPRDEVEGSGMGLALVKKQVDSCGGRLLLDSTGERGTAFHFTWPKRWPQRSSSS